MRSNIRKRGFTLIEIMIVVLIISVLLAIAIPNLVRARVITQEKSCISNLDKILGAKEQCIMEHNLGASDCVVFDDLVPTYLKALPECPAGGTYGVEAIDTLPSCTIDGHILH